MGDELTNTLVATSSLTPELSERARRITTYFLRSAVPIFAFFGSLNALASLMVAVMPFDTNPEHALRQHVFASLVVSAAALALLVGSSRTYIYLGALIEALDVSAMRTDILKQPASPHLAWPSSIQSAAPGPSIVLVAPALTGRKPASHSASPMGHSTSPHSPTTQRAAHAATTLTSVAHRLRGARKALRVTSVLVPAVGFLVAFWPYLLARASYYVPCMQLLTAMILTRGSFFFAF